jgi:hypothetical protein
MLTSGPRLSFSDSFMEEKESVNLNLLISCIIKSYLFRTSGVSFLFARRESNMQNITAKAYVALEL